MKSFPGYKKGVDFGGWLSQCVHTNEHYDTFISADDFKTVADWGCDHIRLPIDYNCIQNDDGTFKDENFKYIDNAITWANQNNLHLILDIHKVNGFTFDVLELKSGFFFNEKLQDYFYSLWETLTKRYAKFQDMLCFELLNEVTSPTFSDTWNKICEKVISRIRAIDKTVTILVGGYWNNSIDALKDLLLPPDEHIVYNFHCYDPFLFTHQAAHWLEKMPKDLKLTYPYNGEEYNKIAKKIDMTDFLVYMPENHPDFDTEFFIKKFENGVKICEERNVALYCGEYGVIENANPEDALKWYKDIHAAFEHYGMGRASWSFRKMNFGLVDDHMKPVVKEIIKNL